MFPGQMNTSQVLFKRLSNKGTISTGSKISLLESTGRKKDSVRSVHTNVHAPDFQQWVRKKDAEKRLKKKLTNEYKRELREELLEYAKQEKDMHDGRVQTMESWLKGKKLNEAYKITQLREDNSHEESVIRDMHQMTSANPKSYHQWIKQKAL